MGAGSDTTGRHDALRTHALLTRYAMSVAIPVAVTLGARELAPFWEVVGRHPYLLEWPTVVAAAWIGGLGPGLVAACLSSVAILFYWIEPPHSLAVARGSDLVAVALYAALAVLVSVLIDRLHRARGVERKLRRAREVVLGVVAHDLRNPLGSIAAAVSMLRRGPDDAARLDVVERAVRRMDHLIRDLVDASRIEADEALSMVLAAEDIDPVVAEAAAGARLVATAKSIAISTESPSGLRVRCDRERMLQVLGNLLDNAVKFTPEGGRIAVRVTRLGMLVRLEITDSGPGIKPEHQATIFERHWTGRVAGAGAGLGLFIARAIVRAHGGRLWVHSEPGHGTSFFLTLPAEDDEPSHRVPRSHGDSERLRLS